MTLPLPDGLLDLLRRPSPCFLATVMPDGSPQLTQTWVTTDGEHIVINTGVDRRKARNIAQDPRVAVTITDPDDTARYYGVRGRGRRDVDGGRLREHRRDLPEVPRASLPELPRWS